MRHHVIFGYCKRSIPRRFSTFGLNVGQAMHFATTSACAADPWLARHPYKMIGKKTRIHDLIFENPFLEFWLRETPCCLQDVRRRGLSVQRVPSWFCGQWSPTMPTWGHEAARVGHRVVFDDSMLQGVIQGYSPLRRQLF